MMVSNFITAAGGFDVMGKVEFVVTTLNTIIYPLWIGKYGITYDFLDNTFVNFVKHYLIIRCYIDE